MAEAEASASADAAEVEVGRRRCRDAEAVELGQLLCGAGDEAKGAHRRWRRSGACRRWRRSGASRARRRGGEVERRGWPVEEAMQGKSREAAMSGRGGRARGWWSWMRTCSRRAVADDARSGDLDLLRSVHSAHEGLLPRTNHIGCRPIRVRANWTSPGSLRALLPRFNRTKHDDFSQEMSFSSFFFILLLFKCIYTCNTKKQTHIFGVPGNYIPDTSPRVYGGFVRIAHRLKNK